MSYKGYVPYYDSYYSVEGFEDIEEDDYPEWYMENMENLVENDFFYED